MIRLTVIDEQGRAVLVALAPYFRITGGAIWIGPGTGDRKPLIRYVAGRWAHRKVCWSGLRFDGAGRLLFGAPCEATPVSAPLDGIRIDGPVLSANGRQFAMYEPHRDVWKQAPRHEAPASTWWHAFRIETRNYRERSLLLPHEQLRRSLRASAQPGESPHAAQ